MSMCNQEYEVARRSARKEYNRAILQGQNPYLATLDNMVNYDNIIAEVDLKVEEIPIKKVKGTKTYGRSKAFASNFMPLISPGREFSSKWIELCKIHLNEGIRDPIKVYEYLGYYYVEEGNKRLSVLKYFGAVRIPAQVIRLVPKFDNDIPVIHTYYAYMNFHKKTGINYIWFSDKSGFNKCYRYMKKYRLIKGGDTSEFQSFHTSFRKVLYELGGEKYSFTTGDAMLKYLLLYGYDPNYSNKTISKNLKLLWEELIALDKPQTAEIEQKRVEKKPLIPDFSILYRLRPLKVAFINAANPEISTWTYNHYKGIVAAQNVLENKIKVKIYNDVAEDESSLETIKKAAEKNEVVFTTSPSFINSTLKAALIYKDVKFLNCSEGIQYKNIRSYSGKFYEANFLVGLVAGAMTKTNKLGYVASYPIPEQISSINAFTIGARFVNPKVDVHVKWVKGALENKANEYLYEIDRQLQEFDVDMVIHQEKNRLRSKNKNAGLYFIEDRIKAHKESSQFNQHLAEPIWNFGRFYINIIRSILAGEYERNVIPFIGNEKMINYWFGIHFGMVDIEYNRNLLPTDLIKTVNFMRNMIIENNYFPFIGELYNNKGRLVLEENHSLTNKDILTMDWFVDGVFGSIPEVDINYDNKDIFDIFSAKKKY